jgi:hypothetical protein
MNADNTDQNQDGFGELLRCPASAILGRRGDARPESVKFLLELLRMFHMVLGITPAKPEHERRYLLLWTVALVLVILIMVGVALLVVPRIIQH